MFSSHCDADSKTVCLIVLSSFHVLHKAGEVGQGNGCFVLPTPRIGTVSNAGADNDTLTVLISFSSSLFTQRLEPPAGDRCDVSGVRVEAWTGTAHSSHLLVFFISRRDLLYSSHTHSPFTVLL